MSQAPISSCSLDWYEWEYQSRELVRDINDPTDPRNENLWPYYDAIVEAYERTVIWLKEEAEAAKARDKVILADPRSPVWGPPNPFSWSARSCREWDRFFEKHSIPDPEEASSAAWDTPVSNITPSPPPHSPITPPSSPPPAVAVVASVPAIYTPTPAPKETDGLPSHGDDLILLQDHISPSTEVAVVAQSPSPSSSTSSYSSPSPVPVVTAVPAAPAPVLQSHPSPAAKTKMEGKAPAPTTATATTRVDQEAWSAAERALLHTAATQWWHWKDAGVLSKPASTGAALYRYFEHAFAAAGYTRTYNQLKNQWSRNERVRFGRSEQRAGRDGQVRALVTSARPEAVKRRLDARAEEEELKKKKKQGKKRGREEEEVKIKVEEEEEDDDPYLAAARRQKRARHD